MANTKNVQLKKKISGVMTELFPKTLATLTTFEDGKNAAEKVAEILTLIATKTDMGEVETRIQQIVGSAPAALDTLNELAAALNNDPNFAASVTSSLAGKVDKVSGKGLSSEDFTAALKTKLEGLSNYTHPASHPASMITVDATHRFVTDTEKSDWGKKGRIVYGTDPGDLTDNDLLIEEI